MDNPDMPTDERDILSGKEAAAVLDLSESAFYRLLASGEIPGAKIGGQWRVRRSDIDHAFDLARARAVTQTRENTAEATWAAGLEELRNRQAERREHFSATEHHDFVLTRCVWCPEWVPAWSTHPFTTLCSEECVAELRRAYKVLGWPMDFELMISPIFTWYEADSFFSLSEYRDIEHSGLFLEMRPIEEFVYERTGPDRWIIATRWRARHERGPLREQLILEHPLLRAYWRARLDGPLPEATPPTPKKKPGDEELFGDGDLEDRFVRDPATGAVEYVEHPDISKRPVGSKGGEAKEDA